MSKLIFSTPRSRRIDMAVPVFIYGCKENGDPFQELTRTLAVDARGGLIELASPVVDGLRVLMVNENTDEDVECRVECTQRLPHGKAEVGIMFNKPSPNFWRVNFSSEGSKPAQSENANTRHFIERGTAPITAEGYRKLMGRTH